MLTFDLFCLYVAHQPHVMQLLFSDVLRGSILKIKKKCIVLLHMKACLWIGKQNAKIREAQYKHTKLFLLFSSPPEVAL